MFNLKAPLLAWLLLVVTMGASSAVAADFSQIKKVAIISAVGEELTLRNFATAFSRSTNRVPVRDWQIDDLVTSRASELLTSTLEIVPVDYDRLAFWKVATDGTKPEALSSALRAVKTQQEVDAYLVILRHSVPNHPFTAVDLDGLGISRNALPLGETVVRVHAIYSIHMVDARSFATISQRLAKTSDKYPLLWPEMRVEESVWPQDRRTLSPDQTQRVKSLISDLIEDSLAESFRRMKLIQ